MGDNMGEAGVPGHSVQHQALVTLDTRHQAQVWNITGNNTNTNIKYSNVKLSLIFI